jgi:hypothetical protein
MSRIMDFLFKVCCLSGIIYWIIGTPIDFMARKLTNRELVVHLSGLNWFLFLLRRHYRTLKGRYPRYLCLVDRFCVMGFIACMVLAILIIIFEIVLKIFFLMVR